MSYHRHPEFIEPVILSLSKDICPRNNRKVSKNSMQDFLVDLILKLKKSSATTKLRQLGGFNSEYF